MSVRPALHALIALLALVASEPFHQWVHGEHGVHHSGHQEIHDGSCGHFPEHRDEGDCLLCIKGHGQAIALVRSIAALGELTPAHRRTFEAAGDDLHDPLAGVLGARAPPALG